jgi:AraC-like DNA-binding protein
MNATSDTFESFRFCSDDLPAADRVPYYRDVISRMLTRMDVESMADRFSCNASFYRLSGLSISHLAGGAVRSDRSRAMAEGNHELVLIIGHEGAYTVSQHGREATVSAGSAALVSAEEPSRSERTASRILCVGIPRGLLSPMLTNPDAALMSAIPSTNEALRLLSRYVDLFIKDAALMQTAELRRLAVSHIHDLAALTIGATRDAREVAAGRGLRAARLRAVKLDIAHNLVDGTVSAEALARRQRVSPRYIHRLFEGEGMTLSQFVLGLRLAQAYRMLTDPAHADMTIGGLAYGVGFTDLSTFNRAFRRRYGAAPSDVRATARDRGTRD